MWSALILAAVFAIQAGIASSQVRCALVDGTCLNWHAAGPAFSADGRYLYFSYRYDPTRTQYSRTAIGRISLSTGKLESVAQSCDANYASPTFSPDGKRMAFLWMRGKGIWKPPELQKMPTDEYWRTSWQVAHMTYSDQMRLDDAVYVPDIRKRNKWSPSFSADGRYIYYAHPVALTAITISRYDIVSNRIEDILGPSSEGDTYRNRGAREYFYSLMNVRVIERNGRTVVLFLARTPHDRSHLYPFISAPRTTDDVRHNYYLYELDVASRDLRLHRLNLRAGPALGGTRSLGGAYIGQFAMQSPTKLVFALAGLRTVPVDRIYQFDDASSEALPEPLAELPSGSAAFALSPDERWIAVVRQIFLKTPTGQPSGASHALRLINRMNGLSRDFDFGTDEAMAALLHRCERQPRPQ